MPEGHTIHRLARQHQRWFAGQRVAVSSPQGRFAGAPLVDGAVLTDTEAHGKHLFHAYDTGHLVHVHLGLIGKFATHRSPAPPPRDTVRMRVANHDRTVDLTGPMVCELVTPDERDAVVADLGPDPLRDDADPEQAWTALQRRRVPIGRALMDQKVLAGVGNVYRAEVLHVHGIHPEVPSAAVTHDQFDAIWATLAAWMRHGVRSGRIVTRDPDEVGVPRSRIPEDEARYVYKQEHCLRCGTPVRRWDLAGRWAYACGTCQPPPRAGAGRGR